MPHYRMIWINDDMSKVFWGDLKKSKVHGSIDTKDIIEVPQHLLAYFTAQIPTPPPSNSRKQIMRAHAHTHAHTHTDTHTKATATITTAATTTTTTAGAALLDIKGTCDRKF